LGQLRFGHAETLLPLYSLMNLPGCNYPDLEIDQVSDFWHDYQITPLAANIQIIYLRSTSGRIYTLTLINSEPTDPLGNGEKFVEWGKLRSYWLARIEQFSIK
jgi:hypothetical protein